MNSHKTKLLRLFFLAIVFFSIVLCAAVSNVFPQDGKRKFSPNQDRSLENILSHQGEYRALLIGISDYDTCPKLETPINDIRKLKRVLTKNYGFKHKNILTLENHNATRNNIENVLFRLTRGLGKNDSLLIYFAGHGQYDQTGDLSWWVPIDSNPQSPGTMISGGTIRDYIKAMRAQHILIISDSCFAGSLFGNSRGLPPILDNKFYKEKFSAKSRWGFTSGNMTPVSDVGGNGHSIFAEHLINYLEKNQRPYLVTSEICTDIAPIISNNSEQLPICKPLRYANDCGGEFIFFRQTSDIMYAAPQGKTITKGVQPDTSIKPKPSENESKHFVDNNDGTITDTSTGLIWQKDDSEFELTFKEARAFCSNLKTGGLNKWRLPTNEELKALYQNLKYIRKGKSNCRTGPFNWKGSYYWSSTKSWNLYYILSFENGKNKRMGKAAKIRVRAVAEGKRSEF